MIDIETLKTRGVQIDLFSYRGIEVPLYEDVSGRQVVAIWNNRLYELGYFNTTYQDDLKLIIDDDLDTISRFEEYPNLYGSKLEYFQNKDNRDVRLFYRGRLLKVWLDPLDLSIILKESIELLNLESSKRTI